jgi:hypothetical protein
MSLDEKFAPVRNTLYEKVSHILKKWPDFFGYQRIRYADDL